MKPALYRLCGTSLGKIGVDKAAESVDRFLLVYSVADDVYLSPFRDAEGKYTQKALRVNAALFLFNPEAAFKLICLLDKESGGSCVETDLIDYGSGFYVHLASSSN